MGASLNRLRKYRLFLTLLVAPALAIAVVVVVIITLFRGDGETDTTAGGTGTPAVTISPTTGGTPSPVRTITPIQVRPTQTPVVVDTPTPAVPAEPTATPEPTPTPEPTGPIVYTIQPDETLSEIAERNGLTVDVLAAFNNLPDAEVIFAGQVIEIPTSQSQIDERLSARPVPVTAVVIPSDGLNVRDQPNTTTSTVQYVARGGTQINLTGIVEDIDGIRWYELDDGNWVHGQYLELGVTAAAAPAAPASTSVNTAVVIPSDGLNVRDQPNTTTSTVQYVARGGDQINLTGVVEEIGGIRWYELDDDNWVQGQFLELGSAASAAPATPVPTAAPAETAAPAQTAAATAAATTAPSDDELTAVVVSKGGLNVRTEPRDDADVAYVAPAESRLRLTGQNTVVDGVTWWEMEDGNWVQGQFLRFG